MEPEPSTDQSDFIDEIQNIPLFNIGLNNNTAHYNYQIRFNNMQEMNNNAEGVTLNIIWQALKQLNSSLSSLKNQFQVEMQDIKNRLTRIEKKVGLEDSPVLVLQDAEIRDVDLGYINPSSSSRNRESGIANYIGGQGQEENIQEQNQNVEQNVVQNIMQNIQDEEDEEVNEIVPRHSMVLRIREKRKNYQGLQIENEGNYEGFDPQEVYQNKVKKRRK